MTMPAQLHTGWSSAALPNDSEALSRCYLASDVALQV